MGLRGVWLMKRVYIIHSVSDEKDWTNPLQSSLRKKKQVKSKSKALQGGSRFHPWKTWCNNLKRIKKTRQIANGAENHGANFWLQLWDGYWRLIKKSGPVYTLENRIHFFLYFNCMQSGFSLNNICAAEDMGKVSSSCSDHKASLVTMHWSRSITWPLLTYPRPTQWIISWAQPCCLLALALSSSSGARCHKHAIKQIYCTPRGRSTGDGPVAASQVELAGNE